MTLTAEQLEVRKTGVGASDAAIVCGVSPWKTPYELYMEKTGQIEPPDLSDNEAVHFGNILEDIVAEEYSRRTGRKVRRRNQTLYHKQWDWMLCHLDRDVVGESRILQCKTAGFSAGWGEKGTDQVPPSYVIQEQHELAVTGKQIADLAVLIAGRDFRIYEIHRDEELISVIIAYESEFMDMIHAGTPPKPDFDHPSTHKLLERLYPGTDGSTIYLPPAAAHWHEVAMDASDKEAEYRKVAEGARAHLRALMGNAAVGKLVDLNGLPTGGGYTRKQVKRKGFTVEPTEFMNFTFKKTISDKE